MKYNFLYDIFGNYFLAWSSKTRIHVSHILYAFFIQNKYYAGRNKRTYITFDNKQHENTAENKPIRILKDASNQKSIDV